MLHVQLSIKSLCALHFQGEVLTWQDGSPVIHQTWNVLFTPSTMVNNSIYKIVQWDLQSVQLPGANLHHPLNIQPAAGDLMCALAVHVPLVFAHYEWRMVPCSLSVPVTPVCQIYTVSHPVKEVVHYPSTVIYHLGMTFVKNSTIVKESRGHYTCHHGWALYNEKCHTLMKAQVKIWDEPCTHVSPRAAQSSWYESQEWLDVITQLILNYMKSPEGSHKLIKTIHFNKSIGCIVAKMHPAVLRDRRANNPFPDYYHLPVIESVITLNDTESCYSDSLLKTAIVCAVDAQTNKCMLHTYECLDHSCISINAVCDGVEDCPGGEDEKCDDFCTYDGHYVGLRNCANSCPPAVCKCHASYFQCRTGGCIRFDKVCDQSADCPDMSDEEYCIYTEMHPLKKQPEEFLCRDDSANISSYLVSDLIPDCPDGSDEKFEVSFSQSWKYHKNICHETHFACHPFHQKCYPNEFKCHYDLDDDRHLKHCRNAAHLVDCRWSVCINHFKCLNSYCIPLHRVCDKAIDCPLHDDEQVCGELQCPGLFRCKAGVCLHPDLLCDGEQNCPIYGDDELYCGQQTCPTNCNCSGHTIICDTIQRGFYQQSVRKLIMIGINSLIDGPVLEDMTNLLWADFSNNGILALSGEPEPLFKNQNLLFHLDISNNKISHLPPKCFGGLFQLRYISLRGNPIAVVGADAFYQSHRMVELEMPAVQSIDKDSLRGLDMLTTLNISSTYLTFLPHGFFSPVISLRNLSIQLSKSALVDPLLFKSISGLEQLNTNLPGLCCLSRYPSICGTHSSHYRCTSIVNGIHEIIIWSESIYILVMNGHGIFKRSMSKMGSDTILILNLHMADFLMAFYLSGISAASILMGEPFAINAYQWFNNPWCMVLSVLLSTSYGTSNALTALISIERYLTIKKSSRGFFYSKTTVAICWSIWFLFVMLGGLPFIMHYLNPSSSPILNQYCLPMNFFISDPPLQVFQYIVHGLMNLFFSLTCSFCYLQIYRHCKACATDIAEMGTACRMNQTKSFYKFPALCMGCMVSSVAVNVIFFVSMISSKNHWKSTSWVIYTVMPLNSLVNPVLHTVSFVRSSAIFKLRGKPAPVLE